MEAQESNVDQEVGAFDYQVEYVVELSFVWSFEGHYQARNQTHQHARNNLNRRSSYESNYEEDREELLQGRVHEEEHPYPHQFGTHVFYQKLPVRQPRQLSDGLFEVFAHADGLFGSHVGSYLEIVTLLFNRLDEVHFPGTNPYHKKCQCYD